MEVRWCVLLSAVIVEQNSSALYVKSRVAMDFSGEQGRVVADPNEALGVAFEEGYNWRVGVPRHAVGKLFFHRRILGVIFVFIYFLVLVLILPVIF